jgi:hypothetical protein
MMKSVLAAVAATAVVLAGVMPTDAEAATRARTSVKIDTSKVKPVCPPRVKPSRS